MSSLVARNFWSKLAFALAVAMGLALASPSDALAQPKRPPTPPAASTAKPPAAQQPAAADAAIDKVQVQLMVVQAREAEPSIDPRLKSIEKHLSVLRYNNFTVLQTDRSTVSVGKSATFAVVDGRKVNVTLLGADEARARVRVEMFKDGNKLLDTTVAINRGGTMMVAGPRYGDGILILPLTASY